MNGDYQIQCIIYSGGFSCCTLIALNKELNIEISPSEVNIMNKYSKDHATNSKIYSYNE